MRKKRYYDEEGNEIRSRPRKPFYQKWWGRLLILLLMGLLVVIGIDFKGNESKVAQPENLEVEDVKEENMDVNNGEAERTEESTDGNKEKSEVAEDENEESFYTYEDFKGTYVAFEGEPYNSPLVAMSEIVVIGDNFYRSFNRWDFDMTSDILNKRIEGDVLTLKLDSDRNEMWGLHSESGTEQFRIAHENGRKKLQSSPHNHTLYSMTNQDLQTHYSQSEIDYARIIMTLYGEPSLDQWAMWSDKWEVPIINVRKNSANDPTEVSNEVVYPEDVTHLDLTNQGMAAGIITYSTDGDGYITRYPMPLHYHQEDQSEEGYRELAQESLDDAYQLYVEPFEPYAVADFIGRVEFVYE